MGSSAITEKCQLVVASRTVFSDGRVVTFFMYCLGILMREHGPLVTVYGRASVCVCVCVCCASMYFLMAVDTHNECLFFS